jgi:nucleoside-diphosphate-sugar epimerase
MKDKKDTGKPGILITGASGFIGGFLVKEALRRGYEVWAGIRSESNRDNLQDEHIHLVDLAYNDKDTLTTQIKRVAPPGGWDYIIHNAGVTKTNNKENFFRVNAGYTKQLIEALAAADCIPKKFILMSSLSSFGKGDEKTFRPIRLTDPQMPETAYGKSKLQAELYLRLQTHFPYVILRPTGVYGPGEKDYFLEIKTIQSGFDFAIGFTPPRITFIYVKDLARIAFEIIENEKIVNKEYFVADGDVYTDVKFARLIQKILGKKHVFHARIPAGLVHIACTASEWIGRASGKSMTLNTDKYIILKQRNWICDVKPLQDDLRFTPEYSLQKGLEESIAWYKEEGWL